MLLDFLFCVNFSVVLICIFLYMSGVESLFMFKSYLYFLFCELFINVLCHFFFGLLDFFLPIYRNFLWFSEVVFVM